MIGNTFRKPNQKQLHNAASATPIARKCCNPTLYIPNKRQGIRAKTTMIIVRLRSIASRI